MHFLFAIFVEAICDFVAKTEITQPRTDVKCTEKFPAEKRRAQWLKRERGNRFEQ